MKKILAASAVLTATLGTLPASPAGATPSPNAPGTTISWRTSQQVMVADRTSGTRGTWARYEWRGTTKGWVRVNGASAAVFGRGGVVDGARRRQGTSTTPAGSYPMVYAFGVGAPSGTRMAYRRVTRCSNWVQVKASDHNRWRESCRDNNVGEHLADYTASLYRQAAVIGFNYDRPVFGRGSGIFLHYARYYTGGCVGLNNRTELTATIRWMDPRKKPVIVIKA